MEQAIAQIITGVIVAAIIFVPAGYTLAKRKLKQLIQCLQKVDTAIRDENVTESEIVSIWERCSELWKPYKGGKIN